MLRTGHVRCSPRASASSSARYGRDGRLSVPRSAHAPIRVPSRYTVYTSLYGIARGMRCVVLRPQASSVDGFESSGHGGQGTSLPPPPATPQHTDPIRFSDERVARLEVALTLRKLYRNVLRAETMLKVACPVYVVEEPRRQTPRMGVRRPRRPLQVRSKKSSRNSSSGGWTRQWSTWPSWS